MKVTSEFNNLRDKFKSLPRWVRCCFIFLMFLFLMSNSMNYITDFSIGFRDGLFNHPHRDNG